MPKQLVVLAGPDESRVFPLSGEPFLLGRSRATDSHLLDPHVSRVHCQVAQEGDHWVVADFDSAGGTFVNGKRINKHTLTPGDIIRIGGTRLQFAEADGAAKPAEVVIAKTTSAKASPTARAPVAQPISGPRGPAWANELIGQKISNFKVGPLLARSRSGFVFHGRDVRKNQEAAIKILDPEFSSNDKAVQRFVDAMKAVSALRHPVLIKFYGAGKTGGHCWMAMEYVDGDSLAAVISRMETSGPLDWHQVLRVGIALARALDYAHSKKLIHQSVAPQNILLGKKPGEVKLTDLMLTTAIDGDPTKPISAAGVPCEELSYMPPERTDGPGKQVDVRADVYSLGATMYAMLAGQPPFTASTVKDLVVKIRLESPASLRKLHPGLPESFERIILKCLAKRPEDRYTSMKELLQQLEALGKPHSAPV